MKRCFALLLVMVSHNAAASIAWSQIGGQWIQSDRPQIALESRDDWDAQDSEPVDASNPEDQPDEGLAAPDDALTE